MRRIALLVGLLICGEASAQTPPYGSNSTEGTGTIAVTGTYQKVFSGTQNGQRKSCTIQTKGGAMLVYFGVSQPANSSGVGFSIGPSSAGVGGGSISCGLVGGGVAQDNVWIEGTANDTFEYASQP